MMQKTCIKYATFFPMKQALKAMGNKITTRSVRYTESKFRSSTDKQIGPVK